MRRTLLLIGASCFVFGTALGQALRDPMEPPAGGMTSASNPGAAYGGAALQSIIVSEGRKLALIDGKTYQAGDKLGDAVIASISGDEVTLRGPEGTRILKLYASLKKAPAGSVPVPAAGKGGS